MRPRSRWDRARKWGTRRKNGVYYRGCDGKRKSPPTKEKYDLPTVLDTDIGVDLHDTIQRIYGPPSSVDQRWRNMAENRLTRGGEALTRSAPQHQIRDRRSDLLSGRTVQRILVRLGLLFCVAVLRCSGYSSPGGWHRVVELGYRVGRLGSSETVSSPGFRGWNPPACRHLRFKSKVPPSASSSARLCFPFSVFSSLLSSRLANYARFFHMIPFSPVPHASTLVFPPSSLLSVAERFPPSLFCFYSHTLCTVHIPVCSCFRIVQRPLF